jgi:hypothetical protein
MGIKIKKNISIIPAETPISPEQLDLGFRRQKTKFKILILAFDQ